MASMPPVLQGLYFGITRAIERRINRFQHTVHVGGQLIIPESDDSIALRFQPSSSSFVACVVRVSIVLRAIKLDDQTRSHTSEIDDVRPDRRLAPEMRPSGRYGAKLFPEKYFSLGRLGAEAARCCAAKTLNW
jgi:hypothetical protein